MRYKLIWAKSHVYTRNEHKSNIDGVCLIVRGLEIKVVWLVWMPYTRFSKAELESIRCVEQLEDHSSRFFDNIPPLLESTNNFGVYEGFSVCIASKIGQKMTEYVSLRLFAPQQGIRPDGYIQIVSTSYENNSKNTKAMIYFNDNDCESTQKQVIKSTQAFESLSRRVWGGQLLIEKLVELCPEAIEKDAKQNTLYHIERTFDDTLIEKSITPSSQRVQWDSLKWKTLDKLGKLTRFGRNTATQMMMQGSTIIPPELLNALPQRSQRILTNYQLQKITSDLDPARDYLREWAAGIAEQTKLAESMVSAKTPSKSSSSSELDILGDLALWEEPSKLGGSFEVWNSSGSHSQRGTIAPISVEQWRSWFDASGRLIRTPKEIKRHVFYGGIEPDARKYIWPFILELFHWHSSEEDRAESKKIWFGRYNELKSQVYEKVHRLETTPCSRGSLTSSDLPEDLAYFYEQRCRIEKDVHRTDRGHPFFQHEDVDLEPESDNKADIKAEPEAEAGSTSEAATNRSLFSKTNLHMEMCKDILLTYVEHMKSIDLGYVQGMSDLLAPIYVLMEDDKMAYCTFNALMERLKKNFYADQSGMRQQLLSLNHAMALLDPEMHKHLEKADSLNFFCMFRFLLVWFKRELSWDDTLLCWDVLFTNYKSQSYQLFIALALFELNRKVILEKLFGFDEILKFFNTLGEKNGIDLQKLLKCAEACYERLHRICDNLVRKHKHQEYNVYEQDCCDDNLEYSKSRKTCSGQTRSRPVCDCVRAMLSSSSFVFESTK